MCTQEVREHRGGRFGVGEGVVRAAERDPVADADIGEPVGLRALRIELGAVFAEVDDDGESDAS